ncbi:hypothetical protein TRFO_14816 [Tritrichomonas foetus]|uniref:Transmembrane protein n=1 Tax=Tritrichomonas foetus TaxID=1144522 RepID=A0A1J4KUA5_9EUKA|nr:hypothetical protein TRFO_14816 [Tritrichomonas foetus]|eukprot:OHT14851.1 hypothetical protein TRFO_14816 [Tritrichomonas foetus]
MCFNKELTLAFTILSVCVGTFIILGKGPWKVMEQWRRARVSYCFYFFALMEGLQFVQYLVIDNCENIVNIAWTQLGYYHICFQPLFSNFAFSALDSRNTNKQRDQTWTFIFWFCTVSGVMMSLRMIIPTLTDTRNQFLRNCTEKIEGFCGPKTCSQYGQFHLKWTFQLLKPSYVMPSISIHFFNMFVTPILMGQAFGSVVLFLSGPFIAAFFDATAGEKASIWCFFSIMETCVTCLSQYIACRRLIKAKNN